MARNKAASTPNPPAQVILRHVAGALVVVDRGDEVLDAIADGIFTVDCDGIIQSFSAKMERLTGIAARDAVGRPCREVLRGSRCDDGCPMTSSLVHVATVEACREQFLGADGRVVPAVVTTALLQDAGGRTTGVTGIVRDDGELERLRRELLHRDTGHNASPLCDSDRDRLRHALEANHWNESRTARALGISRTTLWRRMRRHGLSK